MRPELKILSVLLVVLMVGLGVAACDESNPTPTDTNTTDTLPGDTIADSIPDPEVDTGITDTMEEEDTTPVECTAPPACPTAPANHAIMGMPCITETDCGLGYTCFTESVEVFDGNGDTTPETFVSWLGGACSLLGAGSEGCDPDDSATCPSGSTCVFLFTDDMGQEYYGCLDACSAQDTSMNPYDWNCGCREGYECNINLEACLPGCGNDEECCQIWDDINENGTRDAGEVMVDSDCTNYCDGNSDDEYPEDPATCRASFGCINLGNPTADFGVECLFDADCPANSRCLNEIYYYDDVTGEPYYPGGLCLGDRCDLVGRGCGDDGECINLGGSADPFYACVFACQVGYGPGDAENPCRDCDGSDPDCVPWTCQPYPPDYWYTPSTAGSNGICFPANITDPEGPMLGLGAACTDDEECLSPLGLGGCYSFSGAPNMCSVQCNKALAEDMDICGAPAAAGGVVPGVCWSGLCLPGCDVPDGAVGANGCPQATMACFNNGPSAYGPYSYASLDGTEPTGFCFTGCLDNAWCADVFGVALNCNATTGQCGA